jgi:oxygen-dependent protoporphyrinogen oxidase
MEHGPSSINGASKPALRWSRELGLDAERLELGHGIRRRYLTSGGRILGIPTHPLGFLTSSYLSWWGRARLISELAVPAGKPSSTETVRDFFCRRFGNEFAHRVMDPLVGGLFAGDAAFMSMASAFPALVEMERRHTSILRAAILSRLKGRAMPARRLFSWRRGVAALPHALARWLGADVRTDMTVHKISPSAKGFILGLGQAGSLGARAVIIAAPAHVAARLLEGPDPAGAAAAAAIDAPPLAVVFQGFARRQIEHPLDGIGYLTPSAEGRALLGVQFCSTMFEDRAPEGHIALSAVIGGARMPELARLPVRELEDLVRVEFRDLLGTRGDPVVSCVRRWPHGLPQYNVGHHSLVSALSSLHDRQRGLFVTGNYLGGLSVAVCLERAAATANRVRRYLLQVSDRHAYVGEPLAGQEVN